jgi:KUP system potassium uptake protein
MSSQPSSSLRALTLAALGIVFGDIGTSPLYAFKEAFNGHHALSATTPHVLATLSALFWSVFIVITLKYVITVLRMSNEGEGGVLALTALAMRRLGDGPRAALVIALGVFAAALFYGDAIITPAISVLSAVEGVSVITSRLEAFVIPVTLGILVALFLIQRHGTGKVGKLFGPITVLWFVSLGVLGGYSIWQTPEVLAAMSPVHALRFATDEPQAAFLLLSAVFLALTGGEALYADMGHFGARAVRWGWFGLVWPGLLLNYFGQGALVIRDASAVSNPFFLLVPEPALVPMVILATAATVIASQATISGAYSMTLQACRLGYLPRIRILHTSDQEQGQIYVPTVNWLMLAGVLLLVIGFKSSGALAAAYGIAVSGTMIITTALAIIVVLQVPGVRSRLLLAALIGFGLLESLFLASNLSKIGEGGWLPLTTGALLFLMLVTWKRGSTLVAEQRRRIDIPMDDFVQSPPPDVPRVQGHAVYLTSDASVVPSALFHNLKHYKVMHEQTVFLHVVNENVPYIAPGSRITHAPLAPGLHNLTVRFGFREEPNIPAALAHTPLPGLSLEGMATTYFVARSTVVDGPGVLPAWQCALYGWMTRQAEGAATYYGLPPNQVVELGTQVML